MWVTGLRQRADVVGVVLGGVAALCYAGTVVIGRVLASDGVPSATALAFRFGTAAVAIAAVLVARRRSLLPPPGERLRLALLGGVGYALESTLFYLSLGHGTAAAAALVFYAYPAIVAVMEVRLGHPLPLPRLVLTVGLSAVGTLAVVASGERVAISGLGILFALGAAAVYAVYLLANGRLIHRTDAWTRACWVAAGAALSCVVRGLVGGALHGPGDHLGQLLAYGLLTAGAFGLTFAALIRLGATRTAVVMTLEAFFTVVLGAAFLDESLGATQLLGGAAILAAAGLVAMSRRPDAATPAEPVPLELS